MERFRLFFAGLSPEHHCIACLVKLAARPEDEVRNALQTMANLETQTGECHNCRERGQVYRVPPPTGSPS
jgi:uncharacterized protein with PIN domain